MVSLFAGVDSICKMGEQHLQDGRANGERAKKETSSMGYLPVPYRWFRVRSCLLAKTIILFARVDSENCR